MATLAERVTAIENRLSDCRRRQDAQADRAAELQGQQGELGTRIAKAEQEVAAVEKLLDETDRRLDAIEAALKGPTKK